MSKAKTLEFFFDLSSPYSYLAATQVEALAQRCQAPLLWRPFVLGAVFKAAGNSMPAAIPHKARFMLQDLTRWARHYGVPFRMNSRFPVNAIKAHRLIVAAEELGQAAAATRAAFRLVWAEDRDITAAAELAEVAAATGADPAVLMARSEAPEIKDRLRAYTDDAIRRGAFGAPTLLVGDELFWGNDRLHFVEEALRV